jgi:hypothetical protein
MKNWILSVKAIFLSFALLLAGSCGPTGGVPRMNGVEGPLINVVNGQVLVTFKFLNLSPDFGIGGPVPETRNSTFQIMPNLEDGGMLFVLTLDPADLREINIGIGDPNTLPDGRPIPGIPGGTLKDSLRIDTEFHDMSFYYSEKLFGLWIPFGFDTAGISGYWNLVNNGANIGMFSLIGNDEARGYKAGGLLFLKREHLNNSKLKSLLELSKRYPNKVF